MSADPAPCRCADAPPQAPALLVDIREAARRLSVSDRTVFAFTKSGLLRCVRLGRAVRYDPRDLLAFVDRQKAASTCPSTPPSTTPTSTTPAAPGTATEAGR